MGSIVTIIQTAFAGQSKNWYNFKESNRNNYESGKMKKFLNTIKLLIQDSILSLCLKTFANYDTFMRQFVATSIVINGSTDVKNEFPNGSIVDTLNPDSLFNPLAIKPLFVIDLIRS